jgi:MFS family permease
MSEGWGGRFVKLWTAGTTSALGSGLATIAAPLFIASRTSNPLVVSAGSGVAWLPWLLFALPGGVLVDRVDRRSLMVLIDWARVAAMTVLALSMAFGHASIALLYAVLFVINAGEVVFRSASQAMIADVVPRDQLERANGWLSGGQLLMQQMVAGPLGGLLFAVAVAGPFVANAGTYAASALLVGLIAGAYRAVPDTGRVRSFRGEIVDGFRWLMRQRLLRTMAILIGLLNLTLTAAIAVLVLLVKQRLQLGSVGYGVLFTCIAAGGLLGSLVGHHIIRRVTATWTIRIGLLVEAGTHLALATLSSPVLLGAVLFAFGVHSALWGIVAISLRQRLTPPDMLGRVSSTTLFIVAGGNCVGAVLGGAFAARFGVTAPYWAGFVVALIVAVSTWHVFNRATVGQAYAAAAASS